MPGPTRVDTSRLAKLGLVTAADLALHLPLRWEDRTRVRTIAELVPGDTAQVSGTVVESEVVARPRRALVAVIDDGTARMKLRFLTFWPSTRAQLAVGRQVLAHGAVRGGLFGLEMVHPNLRVARPDTDDAPEPEQKLTPVYPTTAGISQNVLRRAVAQGLREADLDDLLPPGLLQRLDLPPLRAALAWLHNPPPEASSPLAQEQLEAKEGPHWERVILDELVAQQLALARARALRERLRAPRLPDMSLAERLVEALPFVPTRAQRRVITEVARDLALDRPAHRLVQGDVGSGKTVVAAAAAAIAIGSGAQAAMMAPTELLAEQHWRKLEPLLAPLGVRVAWLSGSLKESAKRAVREAISAGEVDLAVGTHALIEEGVRFPRLGLAIVDEQHRFGVAQRLALLGGPEAAAGLAPRPHLVTMSATPIPRTLAMSHCADLDVSTIDELPPGRTPIVTKVVDDARRPEVVERVRAAVQAGRQVYWVCPLIEESEQLDLQTAIDAHALLCAELGELRVGLVHGRLPPAEKASVMARFAAGELDLLVATTVIEVGVDVPNASLMVIEHAERFGLAQLHQLRGRVGRGSVESVCLLMYRKPLSETARERLRIMRETNDGFEIARRDLEMRGPGEFLGARQSGAPLLRFADLLRDEGVIPVAREAAEALSRDPAVVERLIARWTRGREALASA